MAVDDNAFLQLETPTGQIAWLHVSCTEWKNTFSYEIYGEFGKLQIDGLGGSYGTETLSFYKMLPEMGPPQTTKWEYPFPDKSFKLEMENFLTSLNGDDSHYASLSDAYENLKTSKNSDRYQYVLPHYSFDTVLGEKFLEGSLSFESSGSNNLNNTNELQSNIRRSKRNCNIL